jgi:hypothetical protein
MFVIDFNTFKYIKLCLQMISYELRIMFSWCIQKGIEKLTKLYDAYVYDSMIMMSMRCDEMSIERNH